VKKYADLKGIISEAVGRYADDVKARRFPAPENTYPRKG
jgi:3-methyl-2-oxobutanoate hydroxymethyltransferase